MDQLVLIIMGIVLYCVGIATGMYFASQIEKDVNKRTCNCNKNK